MSKNTLVEVYFNWTLFGRDSVLVSVPDGEKLTPKKRRDAALKKLRQIATNIEIDERLADGLQIEPDETAIIGADLISDLSDCDIL